MPPVQPEASVVSTGLGLRYVGNWAYAYSGYVGFTNAAAVPLLDFTSGSGIIVAQCQYAVMDDNEQINEDDTRVVIKFNGDKVFVNVDSGSPNRVATAWPELIIPPFTDIEATMQNITDSSNLAGFFFVSGRVYGTEE